MLSDRIADQMSAIGTKRTYWFANSISASDPKRTLDLLLKTEREKQPFTLKA
jgi:hypothetical protein